MGLRVVGLGFGVWDLGFVWGLFGVLGLKPCFLPPLLLQGQKGASSTGRSWGLGLVGFWGLCVFQVDPRWKANRSAS